MSILWLDASIRKGFDNDDDDKVNDKIIVMVVVFF